MRSLLYTLEGSFPTTIIDFCRTRVTSTAKRETKQNLKLPFFNIILAKQIHSLLGKKNEKQEWRALTLYSPKYLE